MAERRRRAPDPVALVGGLLALGVAASGITGVVPGWGIDVRWLLAVVAVLAGTAYLLAGLRNSGQSSDD